VRARDLIERLKLIQVKLVHLLPSHASRAPYTILHFTRQRTRASIY
jgi:hypothetical protein